MLFQGRGQVTIWGHCPDIRRARRLLRAIQGKTATDPRRGDVQLRYAAATRTNIGEVTFSPFVVETQQSAPMAGTGLALRNG